MNEFERIQTCTGFKIAVGLDFVNGFDEPIFADPCQQFNFKFNNYLFAYG